MGKNYETSHWLFNKTKIAPEVICHAESFLLGSFPTHLPVALQEGLRCTQAQPPSRILLAWPPLSPARLEWLPPSLPPLSSCAHKVPLPQTPRGEAVLCPRQSSRVENFLFNASSQYLLHRYIINHISSPFFNISCQCWFKPPCPGI